MSDSQSLSASVSSNSLPSSSSASAVSSPTNISSSAKDIEWGKHRFSLVVTFVLFIIDLVLTVVLFVSVGASISSFDDFFDSLISFRTSVLDLFFLYAARFILSGVFVWIAIKICNPEYEMRLKARQKAKEQEKESAKENGSINNTERTKSIPTSDSFEALSDTSSQRLSLLNHDHLAVPSSSGGSEEKKDFDRHFHDKNSKVLSQQQQQQERIAALEMTRFRKNVLFVCVFLLSSWHQIQIGVKIVIYSFSSSSETLDVTLMSLVVFCCIFEGLAIKSLIESLTKEEGYYFPKLHNHPLYHSGKVAHWCDLCRQRILKNGFRCQTCDFDLCETCFKTQSKKKQQDMENKIRGDSGLKEEKELSTTSYILRALQLSRPEWPLIFVAFLCLLLTSGSNLLLPNYQGEILDDVIANDSDAFNLHVKLFIFLSIATGAFGSVRSLCFGIVGSRLANTIRQRLFASLIYLDIAYFDGTSTGELTSRLGMDVYAMVSPIQTVLTTFLSSFTLLIGGSIMCLLTSWKLSILAVTSLTPIMQMTRAYSSWSREINREIWGYLAAASATATEAFTNIRTVRAHAAEEYEKRKYTMSLSEALSRSIRDSWASAGTYALTNFVELATGVLLLWYGGSLVMNNEENGLSIGKLITFQLYWNMLNSNFQNLVSVLNSFTRAAGAAGRVLNLIDARPDIDPNVGGTFEVLQGDIELRDVSFTYQMRPNQPVLHSINLKIPAGSVCAFVGRSGAGKSTIVHLLMRFYDVKSGEILVDGRNLADLNMSALRKRVGLVAQDTSLFAGTIEENIAYGLEKEEYSLSDVIIAAKAANCHDFIAEMEDGYQTKIGERGVRLSGGQKQRIAIARAILRKPKFLLLDEATSALDAESEALVQDAIDRLLSDGKCTVILVAHRLSTVMNANNIAVIDGGKMIESGTHQQLLQKGGIYAKLVRRQMQLKANELTQNDQDKLLTEIQKEKSSASTVAEASPSTPAAVASASSQQNGSEKTEKTAQAPAKAAATIDDLFAEENGNGAGAQNGAQANGNGSMRGHPHAGRGGARGGGRGGGGGGMPRF